MVLGYLSSSSMVTGYQSAMLILTFLMVLLTGFIGLIVGREEWLKIRQPPVKVTAATRDELDEDEKFAFEVENITGKRISGGYRVLVQPRKVRVDGKAVHLYRFPQHLVRAFLLGNIDSLEGELVSDSPMYCQTPAAMTDDWRGFWATYLDIAGGDKKKKISTKPFDIYAMSMDQIEEEAIRKILDKQSREPRPAPISEADSIIGSKIEEVKSEYWDQVEEEADAQELDNIVPPDDLTDCVFPTIPFDLGENSVLTVDLRNIGRARFSYRMDEWHFYGLDAF